MTIAAGPKIYLPHLHYDGYVASLTTTVADAAGEGYGYVFAVPKSGNIAKVGFTTGTVTSAQSLTAGIYTLTGQYANLSGAYKSMVAGTLATPAASTSYEVTLSTPANSAVKGDLVAVFITFTSTAGNLQFNTNIAGAMYAQYPYGYINTGSNAVINAANYIGWIVYDDGSYEPIKGLLPLKSFNSNSFASNSAIDERALRVKFSYPVSVYGAWVNVDSDAAFNIVLYDSDFSTALATHSFDGTTRGANANLLMNFQFSAGPVTLAKDTAYLLSLKPTTTTNIQNRELVMHSAASLGAFWGTDFYLCTRADAGSWDTSTYTSTVPLMGLIADGFDAGGGAVPTHPGMCGGMRG